MAKLTGIILLLSYLPSIMAVQIFPATHKARSFEAGQMETAKNGLLAIRKNLQQSEGSVGIVKSSFENETFPSPISPSTNGLVYSLIEAYSSHRHLVIRPEDIWFAVLTQISIYINAHGEELRHKFVEHKGKKELRIIYDDYPSRYHVDFARFTKDMTNLMEENIIDKELREWILPNFSTTTATDTVAASILMMCSMQKYFEYVLQLTCGIPSVTLLGEKQDYENILKRLDKLASWGEEPTRFMELLQPVLRRFILSFDAPKSPEVLDFWGRLMDENHEMSGITEYTGWITAFCVWDEDGNFLANRTRGMIEGDFENGKLGSGEPMPEYFKLKHLVLDGVKYPVIDRKSIPPGWGKVPLLIIDHGKKVETEMVAGSIGQHSSKSGTKDESGVVGVDTIQPHVGWWVWEKTGPLADENHHIIDEL